jgi:hypothetical protein
MRDMQDDEDERDYYNAARAGSDDMANEEPDYDAPVPMDMDDEGDEYLPPVKVSGTYPDDDEDDYPEDDDCDEDDCEDCDCRTPDCRGSEEMDGEELDPYPDDASY